MAGGFNATLNNGYVPANGTTFYVLSYGSSGGNFTNLIFTGIGGSPGSKYVVLVSTNLPLALANWSALTTNKFDVSGLFRDTNYISSAKPQQFFSFKLP